MITGPWAMGDTFTLADCAALPALFYADYSVPLSDWPELAAYLARMKTRPSVARVLAQSAARNEECGGLLPSRARS